MEELRGREPKINMGYYVNTGTIEAIYRALDIPLDKINNQVNGVSNSLEEEDGEIVEEEVDDFLDESWPPHDGVNSL